MSTKEFDNPSSAEVIKGFHDMASLVVSGRRLLLQAKDKYPFYPDVEEFGDKVWAQSGVDFWSVPGRQRWAIAEGSKAIIRPLLARAELQQKYVEHPKRGNIRLIETINEQMEGEIDLNPDNIRVVWGLFSFGIVLKDDDFKRIRKAQGLPSGSNAAGYVTGQLRGELGLIPIIRKGKEINTTVEHEDLHVLQGHMGYFRGEFDLKKMMSKPAILTSLYDGDMKPSDLDQVREFSSAVAHNAENEVFLELQTNLWEKRSPSSILLDNPNYGFVRLAITSTINTAYNQKVALTEEQKVNEVFSVINSFNNINYKRILLSQYANTASDNYKGPLNKWDWTAGLAFTLRPEYPFGLVKAIMLGGRHKELVEVPSRFVAVDLAQATIVHARRTVDEAAYGEGGMISNDKEESLIELLKQMCKNKYLVGNIINQQNFSEMELEMYNEKVVEYAIASVPEGRRESFKASLVKAVI